MKELLLNVEIREKIGSSKAMQSRLEGKLPGVIYVKGKDSIPIAVNQREFVKLLHKEGDNAILTLAVKKADKVQNNTVIIKDIQFDMLSGNILHVDFKQIKLTEKITVDVALVTRGDAEAPGVKDGGILEHILREVKIRCLPTNIPKEIRVDVSGMKVGDAIHVKEIKLDASLEMVTDPEQIAVLVKFEAEEKPAEEKPEGETAAEPEVIKKGKTEEEEAEE